MHRSIKVSYRDFFAFLGLLITAMPMLLQAQNSPAIPSEAASSRKSDPSTSGALFDELARMDNLIFTASFVTCDLKKINTLMTDDIEFYHDLAGLSSGQQVRDNNAKLAKTVQERGGFPAAW